MIILLIYMIQQEWTKREIFLKDVNFEWNSSDKNISITRKLDSAPLHEISFVEDSTNNEKFGIKVHPYTIGLVNDKIKVISNNGKPVDINFDSNVTKSRVGNSINLSNLPPEELIVVIKRWRNSKKSFCIIYHTRNSK